MEKLIKADFRIIGFNGSADSISEQVGLEPDETWLTGQLVMPGTKSPLRYKSNGWSIQSKSENNISLEAHLEDLIGLLNRKKVELREVCSNYQSEFSCTIYLYDEEIIPSMHLSKSIINFVSFIGSEIDIDMYNFGSNHATQHPPS